MNNRRQKKQRHQPQKQHQLLEEDTQPPPPELAAFSLAAAIQEARSSATTSFTSKLPFSFQLLSSPLKQQKNPSSQVSLATNTSFATANDTATLRTSAAAEEEEHNNLTPSATSYFVDSSDEETQESLAFTNDPLSVLSRNLQDNVTPKEISFENSSNNNPEETIIMSDPATTVVVEPTPTVPEATVTEEITEIVTVDDDDDSQPHFDVAQNVYGCTKDVWAWGKTVPVLSNVLGLTEGATAKVLDVTIHMDLPTIDQDVVVPNMKKLDDVVITPTICKVWGIISPAVEKSDEMIVKPVMTEVVPRILAPLGLLEEKKVEEKKNVIDKSPNPEVVPVALN